jgi:hypothetical protein
MHQTHTNVPFERSGEWMQSHYNRITLTYDVMCLFGCTHLHVTTQTYFQHLLDLCVTIGRFAYNISSLVHNYIMASSASCGKSSTKNLCCKSRSQQTNMVNHCLATPPLHPNHIFYGLLGLYTTTILLTATHDTS